MALNDKIFNQDLYYSFLLRPKRAITLEYNHYFVQLQF